MIGIDLWLQSACSFVILLKVWFNRSLLTIESLFKPGFCRDCICAFKTSPYYSSYCLIIEKMRKIRMHRMCLLLVIASFILPISAEFAAIHEDPEYIYESLPKQSNPYVRSSNDYYEKYIKNSGIQPPKERDSNKYPDIHKNKGNVFKPKPLKPGPWVSMTKGSIWPKPKYQRTNTTFLLLDNNEFRITVRLKL